jgi:hypothetical protein
MVVATLSYHVIHVKCNQCIRTFRMPRKDSKTGIEYETAPEYLQRVMAQSQNPTARVLAATALRDYQKLLISWSQRGVKTRRSLYDLLSGVRNICNKVTHFKRMVPIQSGTDMFYFPVFVEVCDYRGKVPPPDAIVTGLLVRSKRRPQETKFGNMILKS